MEIHEAAAAFPMLDDEELDALAADIKANGLRQPIVMYQGKVLDGRNRLVACKKAKIKQSDIPTVEYEGDDPTGFVVSMNLQKRDMTKGQKALVAAKIRNPNFWGSGKELANIVGVKQSDISDARTILEYAPNLVEPILARTKGMNFTKAVMIAKENRKRGDKSVSVTARDAERLEAVRQVNPNLADLVEARDLTLEGAEADIRQRRAEIEASWKRGASRIENFLDGYDQARALARATSADEIEMREGILSVLNDVLRGRYLELEPVLKGLK